MKKLYYDDYIDDNDEISDEEIMDDLDPDSHRIILDDPEKIYTDDDDDDIIVPIQPRTLLSALRSELKIQEPDRGVLVFTKDGTKYEGVPMIEINPDKFVFKLEPDGKLKSFTLSTINVTE